ncbi:MAG: hypothetical protein HC884_08075 [Chloroflexaceae bacterium]|nr:hypothetical protein [Chloroflexaceae bacterium]
MASLEVKHKLETVFSERQADTLVTVVEEAIHPVTSDLGDLKAIVRDLAVAQKALAEAQQRTEQRIGALDGGADQRH